MTSTNTSRLPAFQRNFNLTTIIFKIKKSKLKMPVINNYKVESSKVRILESNLQDSLLMGHQNVC